MQAYADVSHAGAFKRCVLSVPTLLSLLPLPLWTLLHYKHRALALTPPSETCFFYASAPASMQRYHSL